MTEGLEPISVITDPPGVNPQPPANAIIPAPQHDKFRVKGTITFAPGDLNGRPLIATVEAKASVGDTVTGNCSALNGSYKTEIGKFNKDNSTITCKVSCWGFKTKENLAVGTPTEIMFGDEAGVWEYGMSTQLELDPDQQPNQ